MERLMTQNKVDFVVGGFRTEAVMAMQDIAMDYKKIFIGCGAAHPELCLRVAKDYNKYKYFFRGTPFNSMFLVQTSFIHLGTVGAILKKSLNLPQVKIAVVGEKAVWTEPMIKAAEGTIPKMGMEVAGIWQPSDKATDVTAELSAIQRSSPYHFHNVFRIRWDYFCKTGRGTQGPCCAGRHQRGGPKRRLLAGHPGNGQLCYDLEHLCPGCGVQRTDKPVCGYLREKIQ
jgi:hypothetical protein